MHLRLPIKLRWILLITLALLSGLAVAGFRWTGTPESTCLECHAGIEHVSSTHGSCISCHGGDPEAKEKKASHRGMYGKKNPSDPSVWEKTCGRCHAYQLKRVQSNLMYTNTGMMHNIQLTWEGEDEKQYATRPQKAFDAKGNPLEFHDVRHMDSMAGELYRKFCSLCHIGQETNQIWRGTHGSGCAACHFPYNENATYQGGDTTVKGKWPYSADHRMEPLPTNEVCLRCHNRSGRIAMSYQGLNDGNNSMIPTEDGLPGPRILGGRNATSITPDIHFEKGMDCIDCHTSRDIMGDGYAYRNMYQQTEIRCEDCHGSASEAPRTATVMRENEEPVRESRSYKRQVIPGDEMVLTDKGRMYSNVFSEGGKIWVVDKRDGERHESKVITGTPEHTMPGHERLACSSCHSHAVPQCYGCHTEYDKSRTSMDFVKGFETPGAFTETEDYRTLRPFPLALDQRGEISPVTPGCQTFITEVDKGGNTVRQGYVSRFKGENQLRFAPIYSHNTGKRAISCTQCHSNPTFLGFGQHVVEEGSLEATLLCERSNSKPLDGYMTLEDGKVKAFSAVTRENARPLNAAEIRRVWAVNQCLVCHQDPKDSIYQKELDYRALDRCLSRPLPAGR